MRATSEDYLAQLQDLLPPGPAWDRETGSILTKLLHGLAEELSRVHNRALDLIEESDPRTTLELLADWERTAGLPEECIDPPDTLIERRNALVEKLTRLGGQSPQYYIDVAARLGYTITITEFSRHTVQSAVNAPLRDTDWQFTWQVNAPSETVQQSTVQSGVNEPLADWGNDQLECVITRIKPGHTYVRFAYA